jgi:ankyrin repeat protein
MSKHSEKSEARGKGKIVKAAVAGTDDDFDNMLAELRAADATTDAATTSENSNSISSNSTSSLSTAKRALTATTKEVSEDAIMRACARGDFNQLRRWAKLGVRVRSTVPLIQAVAHGMIDAARCLVRDLKADVDQADEQGMTPLFIAAQLSNLEMVRCLVTDLGANVDLASKGGNTPLHSAAQEGHLEVVLCLVKELRADVNKTNQNGCTPVYIAAQEGFVNIVRCLVEILGADVNQASLNGCTPLYIAAQEGNLGMVQCLVEELSADVNQAAHVGSTPLMIAAERMHHKVVRYLLKHGADPQALHREFGTAADASQHINAPAEETSYLQARTHCANPSCSNAGLKKCERCLEVFFCGSACIRAHWPAHKAECTVAAAKLKAASGTPASSPCSSSKS